MKQETFKHIARGTVLTALAFIAIHFIFGTSAY